MFTGIALRESVGAAGIVPIRLRYLTDCPRGAEAPLRQASIPNPIRNTLEKYIPLL